MPTTKKSATITKRKPIAKKPASTTAKRASPKKKVAAKGLKKLFSRGFETKKVALIGGGSVLVLALAFTAFALFQRSSASASVSVASYTSLGVDSQDASLSYRFYGCRTGTTAHFIGTTEDNHPTWRFMTTLYSMRNKTGLPNSNKNTYQNADVRIETDANDTKTVPHAAFKKGEQFAVSMYGNTPTTYIRAVSQVSTQTTGTYFAHYAYSDGVEFSKLRSCPAN